MSREKQVRLLLSIEELDQLRQLAQAHDRSMNSYLRMLLRQAANKTTIELPTKKAKKTVEAEYV